MENPPSLAMAAVVDAGRLLLIRRTVAEGSLAWALPGGGVEAGETPGQAAEREALEEVGIAVQAVRHLGERTHPDTGRRIAYVACRLLDGVARPASPREVAAVAWVAGEQLHEYVPRGLYPPVVAYLRETHTSE